MREVEGRSDEEAPSSEHGPVGDLRPSLGEANIENLRSEARRTAWLDRTVDHRMSAAIIEGESNPIGGVDSLRNAARRPRLRIAIHHIHPAVSIENDETTGGPHDQFNGMKTFFRKYDNDHPRCLTGPRSVQPRPSG